MGIFSFIILATFSISLIALVGVFTLAFREQLLSKILLFLVSLSAGVLMGGAFIHLLPEASEKFNNGNIYLFTLLAFILFFFIEKILCWHHCHSGKCDIHTFGHMNFLGDAVHNFIDGLFIAVAFLSDVKLGFVTSFAVALHEIPQEISDFGVLLYAGFNKRKALFINFLVSLTVIIGGITGYFLSFKIDNFIPYLLAFAAGGFIYIAASDLVPEIRKETRLKKSMISFGIFILGIIFIFLLKQ